MLTRWKNLIVLGVGVLLIAALLVAAVFLANVDGRTPTVPPVPTVLHKVEATAPGSAMFVAPRLAAVGVPSGVLVEALVSIPEPEIATPTPEAIAREGKLDHLEQILSDVEVGERLAFDQLAKEANDPGLAAALAAIRTDEDREVEALPSTLTDAEEGQRLTEIDLRAIARMRLLLTPAQFLKLAELTDQNQHDAIQRLATTTPTPTEE